MWLWFSLCLLTSSVVHIFSFLWLRWILYGSCFRKEQLRRKCADYWMWRGDNILKKETRENNMQMKICNLGNSLLWFITHQETEGFDLYRMECVMKKNWNWMYYLGQRCAESLAREATKSILLLKYPYCFKKEKPHLLMEQYCIHNAHTCLYLYTEKCTHTYSVYSSPCS